MKLDGLTVKEATDKVGVLWNTYAKELTKIFFWCGLQVKICAL